MRYFRAFYKVEKDDDVDLRSLEALHGQFDDKVFALPYHRVGWSDEMNFAASLIFKDSAVSWDKAQAVLDDALHTWGITSASKQVRLEECTVESAFLDEMAGRFTNCCFEETQIKRLLNLNNTCRFISSLHNGMKEVVVEPVEEPGKLFELAADTPYAESLSKEIEQVLAVPDSVAPFAPITYIVEGNAPSDTDEAIGILVGALHLSGRIGSGHVFTIDLDDHDRWTRRDNDGNCRSFINHQLIRAIEGNTLVLRYGLFDAPTGYDLEAYKLLAILLDLMEDAAVGTQLIFSVPEGKSDLIARLRKRYNKPIVGISKGSGTEMSQGSFERNLEKMQSLAAARGIEPDETMAILLSKRMRADEKAELERVFEEWATYHDARIAFPQYAAVIDEAIALGMNDEEVSAQAKLDSLIGLKAVKEHIRHIVMRIEMNQQLMEKGLPMQQFSKHMVFMGAPGTGKTEVARLYAEILKDKGVLKEGRLITVSGGSKFNVRETFEKAKGSVLFIDEAYGLLGYSDMITEIIAQMENNRNDTVVILAGYEGHMEALLSSNPGFRSRIGFTIKFPEYTPDELRSIFAYMGEKQGVVLGDGVDEAVRDILERGGRRCDQGNARFVRKLFEDAVGAQQVRLAKRMKEDSESDIGLDDLRTLAVEDIKQAQEALGFGAAKGKSGREELEALIGLNTVKEIVSARMDFARMQKVKRSAGMEVPFIPMHMAFKGNPGTGKTQVARLIGRILREEGVLSVGDFFECGRQDLVSSVVGGSAPRVEALFEEARGSVIFIDEAYSLIDGAKGGPGDEAINALIDQMEKLRDEVVVIFAGYTKEIDDLLSMNPGFRSRVKTQIEFPDYNEDELVEILHSMATKQGYILGDGIDAKVRDAVAAASRDSDFGNARFIRNLLEDAIVQQSVRLAATMDASDAIESLEEETVRELSLLLPEDFTWDQGAPATTSIGFAA